MFNVTPSVVDTDFVVTSDIYIAMCDKSLTVSIKTLYSVDFITMKIALR